VPSGIPPYLPHKYPDERELVPTEKALHQIFRIQRL
jgi:hypothetical protein